MIQRQHLGFGQPAPGGAAQLFQILPFDEIHHQVLPLPGDDEVILDQRQVRVAQHVQQAGFTQELALRLGRGLEVLFDGTDDLKVEIPGLVDRAEAALSEQFDDAVAVVEDLALGQ